MAENEKIGSAYLEVVPKVSSDFGNELARQGEKDGEGYGSGFSGKMKGLIGAGSVFVGNLLANMASQALNALGQFVGDSVQAGMSFDNAMSQVAATMGTTVDQIQDLEKFAQEMGRTTGFSATEAAEALNYMALAGYDAEKQMTALPSVLNLATAGAMDLARASDMVTDAQSALGIEFENIDGFVDQLAKTASTTNTSVEQLGDAILTVGGTAKMMKGGTAELNQVLGLLADNGIKGSEGGIALRNMLLSLASPTDAASKTLQALGVEVFNAEGDMRSMNDIIADLNRSMDGFTSEERTQAISNIFNKRDLKSVEALLNTTGDRWNEVAEAIDNAQGAAQKMADTQFDNLQGDVVSFQSALEGLQIELFHGVSPALRGFVQGAKDGLLSLTAEIPGVFSDLHDFFFGVEDEYDELGNVINVGSKGIFSDMSGTFADIQKIVEKVWPTVQNIITGVVNAIKSILKIAWPIISGIVQTATFAIEQVTEKVWPVIDAIISGVVQNIQNVLHGLEPLGEFISGVFETIRTSMENPLQSAIDFLSGLPDTVGGIFDGIKSAMETPIQDAVNFLSGIPGQITGFFSGLGDAITWAIGSIHFPTPHITWEALEIAGMTTPISLPHVAWYAKGGIVDGATLIGAGEAGPELILPQYGATMDAFADSVARRVGGGVDIHDCTFVVRKDSDIRAIAYQLNEMVNRQRAGALA